MSDPRRERGQLRRIEHLPRVARQRDRLASPRLVDDRRDAGADDVRRRVDVGDQPDHRRVDGAGQRREDREAFVQLRVGEPDLAELLDEQAREVELLLGARALSARGGRLRVDADVAEEPLEHVARELLGQRAREGGPRSQALRAG